MSLHLSKLRFKGGNFYFFLNLKGLNRDIDVAAITKKNPLKRRFWTNQKHHSQDNWNPQKAMFFDFFYIFDFKRVFLVVAVFVLFRNGVIFSTLRLFEDTFSNI